MIEKALEENFPFVITFESGNPTEEYSLVEINGLRLYVVKCNACDELLPKCMTCEHSRMHVNGPQIENSEEFCYYHEDLSKKFEPENLNEKLQSIFIKYKKPKNVTRTIISNDSNLELVLLLSKNMPSNHRNCCFNIEDCESKQTKQFQNVMYRNKRKIKDWVMQNHDKTYDGKPLSIFFPLLKTQSAQKKTRKRGMNSLPSDNVLPTKRRSEITTNLRSQDPVAFLERDNRSLRSQLKKFKDNDAYFRLLLQQNDIEFDEPELTADDPSVHADSAGSIIQAKYEPCDTFYINKGKYLLQSEEIGAIKRCSVDLVKRSLTLQIDGNLNASQVAFVFRDFVQNLGLFPKGNLYSIEFFRSHRQILPVINEYVLANRLKNGSEFSIYFDGSPSLQKKNLISYGFVDENCDSFNLGIKQFEHNRSDKEKKSSVEADFILDHIKKICSQHELNLVETLTKVKSVISDNAAAAESCRKYLIKSLQELAPLLESRFGLGCSAHLVALLEKWILDCLKLEPELRKISGYLSNVNGQESAAELWNDMTTKYKFKYIRGSRWGVLAFNSGIVFLEESKLMTLLERRKSIDSTASQILEFLKNKTTMNKIAVMAYCFGICKLLWKCLIKKQRKRDLIHRLEAITRYQKDIQNLSINGENIQLSDISNRTNELKKDLESNERITVGQLMTQIHGKQEKLLLANSEFQKLIDQKFTGFIRELTRVEQVEVLMQTASCIKEAFQKMLKFFKAWFEFDHANLDQFIVPSNLEVERRFALFSIEEK